MINTRGPLFSELLRSLPKNKLHEYLKLYSLFIKKTHYLLTLQMSDRSS